MAKPSMGACAPGEDQNVVDDGERRSRNGDGLAAEFVAGLPAMVDGLAPDARLLAACEVFLTLDDQQAAAILAGDEALADCCCSREGRWHGVRAAIVGTRARTALGRRAKADAALRTLPLTYELALVRAALEDCLDGLDEGVRGGHERRRAVSPAGAWRGRRGANWRCHDTACGWIAVRVRR